MKGEAADTKRAGLPQEQRHGVEGEVTGTKQKDKKRKQTAGREGYPNRKQTRGDTSAGTLLPHNAPNLSRHRIATLLRILLKLKGRGVAARGARER
jgi:hypothetical protein